jgi:hypothetical protein
MKNDFLTVDILGRREYDVMDQVRCACVVCV